MVHNTYHYSCVLGIDMGLSFIKTNYIENGNTMEFVRTVIINLRDSGVDVLLGGGWAEELHGIIKPRDHSDIDLYYLAEDFNKLDKFIKNSELEEIKPKHKSHKRAFNKDGVMVEVILVQKDYKGYLSNYNQEKIIGWPAPLSTKIDGLACLSREALAFKRSVHNYLFPRE